LLFSRAEVALVPVPAGLLPAEAAGGSGTSAGQQRDETSAAKGATRPVFGPIRQFYNTR
jgi:hypothetical protein